MPMRRDLAESRLELAGPARQTVAPPRSRIDYVIALCLVLVVVIAGGAIMAAGVTGVFHDDAVYVSTARALAQGEGYRLIDLPDAPRQTKYPVLYPALLALVWKIAPDFPDNVAAMQWVTLTSGGIGTALAYLYLVSWGYASRLSAAIAGAMAATTPFLGYIYGLTLSEALFAALVVAALWRLDWHLASSPPGVGASLVTGVLLASPFLCRSVGVVVIVAGLACLLGRRKVGGVIAGVALASSPWVAWSLSGTGAWQTNAITGYYTDYAGAWTAAALPLAVDVAARNGLTLLHATSALPLEGIYLLVVRAVPPVALLAALIGLTVWTAIAWFARSGRVLPIFLVLYAGLLLAWPWPPARFLVPVLALVLGVTLSIAGKFLTRFAPATARSVAIGVLIACVGPNTLLLAQRATLNREYGYPYYSRPQEPVAWPVYLELFQWIREHTRETDTLAAPLDSMISAYTGRRAFRPYIHRPGELFYGAPGSPVGAEMDLIAAMEIGRATYLVVTPMFEFAEARAFQDLVERSLANQTLVVVHEGADRRFKVLRRRATDTRP
jgi:hypothetical protein